MVTQVSKRFICKTAFNATLLLLLTLFTVLTQAEESSILDGAIIANPSDFLPWCKPESNQFFGVGFKSVVLAGNDSPDFLGDGSKELKI